MRQSLKQSRRLPPEVLDGLKELGEMPELEEEGSIFDGCIDRAFEKARNESKLEGKLEALNRLALKKFGTAGQGKLPSLISGIQGERQLDDALDCLLKCGDADQFEGFLRRASNGS